MPINLTRDEERTFQTLLQPVFRGSVQDFLRSEFTILFRNSSTGVKPTNQDVVNLNSYHKLLPFLVVSLLMKNPMLTGASLNFDASVPNKNVEAIFAKYNDIGLDEEDIIYSYGAINNYFGDFVTIENSNFIINIESDEGENETRTLYPDSYNWNFTCSYKVSGNVESTSEWSFSISRNDDEILTIDEAANDFFQTITETMRDLMKECFRKEIA